MLESITVSAPFTSDIDGRDVVQIDTGSPVRVYLNDAPIFDGDPESPARDRLIVGCRDALEAFDSDADDLHSAGLKPDQHATALAASLRTLILAVTPNDTAPQEDEESWCTECGTGVEHDVGDYGMCGSCLHDAYRSGWLPGEQGAS